MADEATVVPPEIREEARSLWARMGGHCIQEWCAPCQHRIGKFVAALLRARQAGVRRGDQLRCLINEADSDPRPGSLERLAAYVEQLKEERGDG